jgi:hypothetical protein
MENLPTFQANHGMGRLDPASGSRVLVRRPSLHPASSNNIASRPGGESGDGWEVENSDLHEANRQ